VFNQVGRTGPSKYAYRYYGGYYSGYRYAYGAERGASHFLKRTLNVAREMLRRES